jgi:hypothetical protein
MPRFVIQEHQRQGEETHWDLMLEQGNSLKTFRLNLPPQDIQASPGLAVPIADHKRRFLTYEGPVNQGQGSVRIVEQGHYTTQSQSVSNWSLSLDGTLLRGTFKIAQLENGTWQFQPITV